MQKDRESSTKGESPLDDFLDDRQKNSRRHMRSSVNT